MKVQMKKAIIAIAVLLLTGCAYAPPTAQEIAAVGGYGAPLTIDWQAAVKTWFFDNLKDPMSAQYVFYKPFPGYVHTAPIEGAKLLVGYKVVVKVNAKNSFGGYIGFRPYVFLFRDNRVIFAVGPDSATDTAELVPYE